MYLFLCLLRPFVSDPSLPLQYMRVRVRPLNILKGPPGPVTTSAERLHSAYLPKLQVLCICRLCAGAVIVSVKASLHGRVSGRMMSDVFSAKVDEQTVRGSMSSRVPHGSRKRKPSTRRLVLGCLEGGLTEERWKQTRRTSARPHQRQ